MKSFWLVLLAIWLTGCDNTESRRIIGPPAPINNIPGLFLSAVHTDVVILQLEDNSDEELGFPLYQRLLGDSTWQLNRTLPATHQTGYSVYVFDLDSTATYQFQVTALLDSAGQQIEIGPSEIVTVAMPYAP